MMFSVVVSLLVESAGSGSGQVRAGYPPGLNRPETLFAIINSLIIGSSFVNPNSHQNAWITIGKDGMPPSPALQ
eukprot:scaffold307630_cov45-Prasinocladus_malaysianus.AAC.1